MYFFMYMYIIYTDVRAAHTYIYWLLKYLQCDSSHAFLQTFVLVYFRMRIAK